MFFVEIQDMEDAIENKIWAAIITERFDKRIVYNEDQVLELKNRITTDREGKDKGKCYKLLQKEVRLKYIELFGEDHSYDIFPSKGSGSAEMLLKHVTTKNQIPEKIRQKHSINFNKILCKVTLK